MRNTYGNLPPEATNGRTGWFGSVLVGQQDGSGLMYRRNRYYDPVAGRFTQEDPIGLAGGLNVYGFANGDSVNYADPFGLCPMPTADCPPGYFTQLGAASGTAGGVLVAAGCTAGSGGVCVAGAPAIVAGSIALGTSVGAGADYIAQHADALAVSASELGDKIRPKVHRFLETLALAAGIATSDQPPKKPDDEDKPPPPAPTSPKTLVPDERKHEPE